MALVWFDAKEDVEFGYKLADFCADRLGLIVKTADRKRNDKVVKLVSELQRQVLHHGNVRKLNMYKKAKLGNAFKWRLTELGCDTETIDSLLKEIFLALK